MANKADTTRSKLYTQAQRVLRDKHPEEWHEILSALYEKEGLTYRRRLSPQERAEKERAEREAKAEEKLARLIEQYPNLADRVK